MWSFLKKLLGLEAKVDVRPFINSGSDILDVRSEKEFAEGHIKGSINIPLDQIGSRLDEVKNLNEPIIAVCRSGRRSGMATKQLKRSGFKVYNGGGWEEVSELMR